MTAAERARELLTKWYRCPEDHDLQEADLTAALDAHAAEAREELGKRTYSSSDAVTLQVMNERDRERARADDLRRECQVRRDNENAAVARAEKAEARVAELEAMEPMDAVGWSKRARKAEARVAELERISAGNRALEEALQFASACWAKVAEGHATELTEARATIERLAPVIEAAKDWERYNGKTAALAAAVRALREAEGE
jgi:hypothetical protein